ncbi:Dps family protein [Flectobacillus major]|jgi:starvation-inducible DNA-binding protein|uniref:Dps family protein n=1 Tax=Flectobacillus major TaxID=103 RepID=UPI000405F8C0|nr:DNA starvation/stationary phase protection protein [Flectobacillus major]
MFPNIGISPEHLKAVSTLLNVLLADEYVLYTKTRNYHWNVTGPHFSEYHSFFEELYTATDTTIDDIAERVRALGHYPIASLGDFLAVTRLLETKHQQSSATEMLQELLNDHESLIRLIRQDIGKTGDEFGDEATADFLTGLLADHEKIAWKLRAYLS